jgi:hypothetical protein
LSVALQELKGKLVTSESRSEVPGRSSNVVLEKDAEDQLDRPCEELGIIARRQGGEEYPTYNTQKKS